MKKKIITISAVAALALALLVGGTLAYFTDTDKADNEFTVGNVEIELVEPKWAGSGSGDAPEVYPGEALAKDPTVNNVGDNPCFVRVKVEGLNCLAPAGEIGLRYKYADGYNTTDWTFKDGYYYYNKVVGADYQYTTEGMKKETTPLFDQIVMPTDLTNGYDGEYDIQITAEAVQAQGAKPSWSAVKSMTVDEIAAWFDTCMN